MISATRDLRKSLSLSANESMVRLIEELAHNGRVLNRSQVIRTALIEKADRDLSANWRERIQFTDEDVS